MTSPGSLLGRQPETTGDNLKTEVVSLLGIDNQALASTGDGGDNLFESLTCARGGKVFSAYMKGVGKRLSPVSPSVVSR